MLVDDDAGADARTPVERGHRDRHDRRADPLGDVGDRAGRTVGRRAVLARLTSLRCSEVAARGRRASSRRRRRGRRRRSAISTAQQDADSPNRPRPARDPDDLRLLGLGRRPSGSSSSARRPRSGRAGPGWPPAKTAPRPSQNGDAGSRHGSRSASVLPPRRLGRAARRRDPGAGRGVEAVARVGRRAPNALAQHRRDGRPLGRRGGMSRSPGGGANAAAPAGRPKAARSSGEHGRRRRGVGRRLAGGARTGRPPRADGGTRRRRRPGRPVARGTSSVARQRRTRRRA